MTQSDDTLDRIYRIHENSKKVSKHKKKLNETVHFLNKVITSFEFESYHTYCQLKSFRKGYSETGIVDLDEVRNKDRPLYYTKLNKKNKDKKCQSARIQQQEDQQDSTKRQRSQCRKETHTT